MAELARGKLAAHAGWRVEVCDFEDSSAEEWVELLRTSSDHRILAPERLRCLLDAVARAIEQHGGTYAHRTVCELWAAPRV